MNPKILFVLPALALAGIALFWPCHAPAGGLPPTSGYTVLSPIRHGNLTVFPVVAARSYDTEEFLTLDEGLRSGEVIVTESGGVQPLMRRRLPPTPSGAQVNQLVLVNNSKRPLDSAGRRDRDRRETGPGHRQRSDCSGRERSHLISASSASNRAAGRAAVTDLE